MTTPLADLDHPSPQQLFNAVVAHAAKMLEKSQTDTGCLYRSPNGNACFIGCLLTDDEVKDPHGSGKSLDQREDTRFDNLHDDMPDRLQWDDQRQLLSDLQNIHDTHEMDDWAIMLKELGNNHGLGCECIDLHFVTRS